MYDETEFLRRNYTRCKTAQEAAVFTDLLFMKDGVFEQVDDKGRPKFRMGPDAWHFPSIRQALESADRDRRAKFGNVAEAIGPSEFPQLVSGFIASDMLRAYDDYERDMVLITGQLFGEDRSKKKGDKIMRMNAKSLMKPTPWGISSSPIELGTAYVTCSWVRFTRHVELLEDAIMHEQTGDLWNYATDMAGQSAETLERVRMDCIMDNRDTHQALYPGQASFDTYQPSGTGAALYSSSSPTSDDAGVTGNIVASNDLEDYTSIDACDQALCSFLDDDPERTKDTETNAGKRVRQSRNQKLLIPKALNGTASIIFKSLYNSADSKQTYNPAGANGDYNRPYLVSQDLDPDSKTTWYYGDFPRTFKQRIGVPVRVLTANRQSQWEMMSRGSYGKVMIEWYYAFYATSRHFVVKCTAA